MSDDRPFEPVEGRSYNPIQLSTFINGDQLVFRAEDGNDLAELVAGTLAAIEKVTDDLNKLKQYGVANAVFTGDSKSKGADTRAADSGPGGSSGGGSGDSAPNCGCGVPMVDLKHKGYKNRWYAGKGCQNEGKQKQCWAKRG